MIRWLITLLLVLAAAFLLWDAFGAWQSYAELRVQVEAEQGRLASLLSRRKQLVEQKASIEDWNALCARVQAAGISPNQWVTNDIHTRKDMSWPELEQLMDFLSHSHPQTTGIWFKPETFFVSRAGQQTEVRVSGDGNPEGSRQESEYKSEALSMYTVRIDGEFLIPRTDSSP